MQTNKVIQKKPKDGSTSPQRSKKDKVQKEERYKFQIVPLPKKFANVSKIHRLYADLIIMEGDDTLISDSSLYNHFKIYKLIEIEKQTGQRLVRLHLQNKFNELEDWRNIVAKIRNSGSSNIRSWAESVKAYCERYEEAIKEFQGQLLSEKISKLIEINAQTMKIRQTLINTYPLVEFKSEFRNGHIELTEIAYSEKYLAEMSYTGEELVNAVFKGGIPMFYPLNAGSSWPAKIGLENWIALDPNGCKTPEIDIYLLAKDGSTKTVKGILHYYVTYEGEAPGFLCYITLTERSKPCTDDKKSIEKLTVTKDFVNASFEKEMEQADFLEMFYGIRTEQR